MPDMPLDEFNQGLQELQRQHARDHLRVIVARAEGNEFLNCPAGVFKEVKIGWDRGDATVYAADIERIQILEVAGPGSVDWEVRTKSGGTGLEVVVGEAGVATPIDKRYAPRIAYLSEAAAAADKPSIVVAIKPIGGIGTYKVRIYARPLR